MDEPWLALRQHLETLRASNSELRDIYYRYYEGGGKPQGNTLFNTVLSQIEHELKDSDLARQCETLFASNKDNKRNRWRSIPEGLRDQFRAASKVVNDTVPLPGGTVNASPSIIFTDPTLTTAPGPEAYAKPQRRKKRTSSTGRTSNRAARRLHLPKSVVNFHPTVDSGSTRQLVQQIQENPSTSRGPTLTYPSFDINTTPTITPRRMPAPAIRHDPAPHNASFCCLAFTLKARANSSNSDKAIDSYSHNHHGLYGGDATQYQAEGSASHAAQGMSINHTGRAAPKLVFNGKSVDPSTFSTSMHPLSPRGVAFNDFPGEIPQLSLNNPSAVAFPDNQPTHHPVARCYQPTGQQNLSAFYTGGQPAYNTSATMPGAWDEDDPVRHLQQTAGIPHFQSGWQPQALSGGSYPDPNQGQNQLVMGNGLSFGPNTDGPFTLANGVVGVPYPGHGQTHSLLNTSQYDNIPPHGVRYDQTGGQGLPGDFQESDDNARQDPYPQYNNDNNDGPPCLDFFGPLPRNFFKSSQIICEDEGEDEEGIQPPLSVCSMQ